jgi:hypothetical protein
MHSSNCTAAERKKGGRPFLDQVADLSIHSVVGPQKHENFLLQVSINPRLCNKRIKSRSGSASEHEMPTPGAAPPRCDRTGQPHFARQKSGEHSLFKNQGAGGVAHPLRCARDSNRAPNTAVAFRTQQSPTELDITCDRTIAPSMKLNDPMGTYCANLKRIVNVARSRIFFALLAARHLPRRGWRRSRYRRYGRHRLAAHAHNRPRDASPRIVLCTRGRYT